MKQQPKPSPTSTPSGSGELVMSQPGCSLVSADLLVAAGLDEDALARGAVGNLSGLRQRVFQLVHPEDEGSREVIEGIWPFHGHADHEGLSVDGETFALYRKTGVVAGQQLFLVTKLVRDSAPLKDGATPQLMRLCVVCDVLPVPCNEGEPRVLAYFQLYETDAGESTVRAALCDPEDRSSKGADVFRRIACLPEGPRQWVFHAWLDRVVRSLEAKLLGGSSAPGGST